MIDLYTVLVCINVGCVYAALLERSGSAELSEAMMGVGKNQRRVCACQHDTFHHRMRHVYSWSEGVGAGSAGRDSREMQHCQRILHAGISITLAYTPKLLIVAVKADDEQRTSTLILIGFCLAASERARRRRRSD